MLQMRTSRKLLAVTDSNDTGDARNHVERDEVNKAMQSENLNRVSLSSSDIQPSISPDLMHSEGSYKD